MIEVREYDASWAAEFRRLHDLIWPRIRHAALAIEHVGSTAVPGLAAKPVIDVDVVIASMSSLAAVCEALGELGYTRRGDLGIAGREAFRAPPAGGAAIRHHLYVCVEGSLPLRNHLALRDHLRRDAASARAYSELKRQLAARFPDDMDGYVEGKTEFIVSILERAGAASEDELRAVRAANAAPPRA